MPPGSALIVPDHVRAEDVRIDRAPGTEADAGDPEPQVWIKRLNLTNYRNYSALTLELDPGPVVLTGANGSGKTNLLEAVSLLAPGQGLRRSPFPDLSRSDGDGGWSVAGTVQTPARTVHVGTGQIAHAPPTRAGRMVRIDRQPVRGSGALGDHLEVVWLTPAMDGLFTGPAGDRRRFLDRLIGCFDKSYRGRLGQFERAMRQRNRLLEDEGAAPVLFEGLELQMAQTAVAITATRLDAIARILASVTARRERSPDSPFPWIDLTLDGQIETWLGEMPALDAEDAYLRALRAGRPRDKAARRTLTGPHRSDLSAYHGPKGLPARVCSTGEQKALLVNLVLAHAELVRRCRSGAAPILLLDEIAAHLDRQRRAALFGEILALGSQAWLSGTDENAFEPLAGKARHYTVDNASVSARKL